MRIDVINNEDVLMVNYQNNYYPVCSENFDEDWGDHICDAMGFGFVEHVHAVI